MNPCLIFTILTIWSVTQVALPEKIQNIEDLKKLAEKGDSNAQCLLGLQEMIGGDLYDPRIIETVTVEQILLNKLEKWRDQVRALPSFHKGSEFETGGKTKEAFKWVEKSAQQGNKVALYCLGIFYGYGMEVKMDYDKAYKNLEKSANLGFEKAFPVLYMLSIRQNDQKHAMEWLWRGFDAGNLDCKVEVGRCFLYGANGVKKDEYRGFRYVEEAYRMHSRRANSVLGLCYLEGLGTSKDVSKAHALFKEGLENNPECKFLLGKMYLNGTGVEKDQQKGIFLIEEVASQFDNPPAKAYLGMIYATGLGVEVDKGKALELFKQAASMGSSEAMLLLGMSYYNGTIVQKDEEQAKMWLEKAKDRGIEKAADLLKKIKLNKKNDRDADGSEKF